MKSIRGVLWWPVWCLLAVLAIEFIYLSVNPGAQQPLSDGDRSNTLVLPEFKQLERGELTSLTARPLFESSRRPPVVINENNEEQKADPARLKNFLLTAVVITTDQRFAIFKDLRSGQMLKKFVADNLEQWEIDDIQPYEVAVVQGDETHILTLRRVSGDQLSISRPQQGTRARGENDPDVTLVRPKRDLQREAPVISGPEAADQRVPQRPKRH